MKLIRDNVPVLKDIHFLIKSFCSWMNRMDEFNPCQNTPIYWIQNTGKRRHKSSEIDMILQIFLNKQHWM